MKNVKWLAILVLLLLPLTLLINRADAIVQKDTDPTAQDTAEQEDVWDELADDDGIFDPDEDKFNEDEPEEEEEEEDEYND